LILSTGEEIPRGHSVRARLWILEVQKGDIDHSQLTACQRDARAGLYSEAMGAFVRWFSGCYEDKRSKLNDRAAELRILMQSGAAHARTPDIMAHLQGGFEIFLEFAAESGAITSEGQHQLAKRCWDALLVTAAAQAKHQSETEPATRFLSMIRGCLASGRAHLASRKCTMPEWSPESCGWRGDRSTRMTAQGECIGWIDGEDIYLEPTAAYQCVQNSARDEMLAVSVGTLKKRLREKGLLASTDENRETLTVRRTICGSIKDVLHLLKSTLLPEATDDEDGDVG
jgi:hypothetical protein